MKLKKLKEAFENIDLGEHNNKHLDCGTVIDARKFVDSSIRFLEQNKGNELFLPYYNRLLTFYKTIKTEQNEY
tara:strand:- start:248 stop:466 length:219 start_codon:yes stop_codon:yes gene_type:complete